jgi:hypothetical protein
MTKKIALILTLFVATIFQLNAQIEDMRKRMDDAMTEIDDGKLTLYFINALDGEAVKDATVNIAELGEFTTNAIGRLRFDIPKDGLYLMHFNKAGFITEDLTFEVILGTVFHNRFMVSPIVDVGCIRIVLDWDKKPKDLDAHLKKINGYHISYRENNSSTDGRATLDRDDRDGFGPETISIRDLDDNAEYEYYVKDYSNKNSKNSKQLSKAKARVKVYGEDGLIREFQINEKQKGNA